MSVVKKLIIQGVRSFSPNDNKQQFIDFQTPLTLILGVNGSGKTTIIEALKYAITNKFPPNCLNGSSFVNDPKLTNGYESNAMVKLEVVDGGGNQVVTTRRVKVSVKDKAGNLTKKELDATMKITDTNGETKEISNKCVDTKTEMCRIMGVSEAILNHVILCHQEDSCWPLDEAKKVKEKFDSIFNTTLYIKCVDLLTKQDKELGQRLKEEQAKFNYVVDNRKIARKKKKDLEVKETEFKAVTDQIEKYEKDLREMEIKLRNLQDMEKEYTEIANKVSATEGKLEMVQKQVTEIKSNMKEEIEGDIATLRQSIATLDQEHKSKAGKLEKLEHLLQEKESELKRITVQQKTFLVEEGKYQQEEEANQQRRDSLVQQISDVVKLVKKVKESSQNTSFSHSMDSVMEVFDGDAQALSADAVIKALSSVLRARESEINKTKAQYENQERDIQKRIDDLRAKKTSIETEIGMKNKQIQDNLQSAKDLKNRLQKIEGSDATLALLEEEQQNKIDEIAEMQKSGILEKYDTDLKSLSKEIKGLETVITEATDDFEELTKDKGKLDQITIYNRQKVQKQNECKEIMRRIEDDLKTVLGDIEENDLGTRFENKRQTLNKDLLLKKADQKQQEKGLTVNETELKRLKNDLQQKLTKIEGWKDRIALHLDDRNFDDVYEDVSGNLEASQKGNYYAEAAIHLYKQYIQKLNKKECCPLCKRDIDTKKKVQALINEIKDDIERMQKDEPAEREEIEKLKTKLNDLNKLKPIWLESKKLENEEIPALKEKKSCLEMKVNELSEVMDDLNETVAVLENDKSTLDKISQDVGLFENAKKEIKQRELNITSAEGGRTARAKKLQETTSLSNAKTRLQDLKNFLQSKQVEKDKKSELLNQTRIDLNKLQDDKNKLREEILQITSELQNREALEVQKKELEEANKQLHETIATLSKGIPSAKADISEAESLKLNSIEKKDKHLHELRLEKEALEKQKSKLNDVSKLIDEFEQKKGKFLEIQKRSAECKQKLERVEGEKRKVGVDLEAVQRDISNHEIKHRNLRDNLGYKEKLDEVAKLKVELAERRELFASTQNRGVAAERREIGQKHQDLSAKMNEHRGKKKMLISVIMDLKKELDLPTYANAEAEFTERYVKKTIYEKTQRDVRRYKTALDHAILQFHSKRMEMINKILWDYWRRIYKGNDIDYIQIRTESGNPKPPAGAGHKVKIDTGKSRKSYNYRVVMVRRGHELDMRGRCSAGQRVLASIIIRIALAESFSTRCGMITLDEPTTNLDQLNINSLADALSSLAEKMSSRNNFQLIVITHDQEFTDRLSAVDAVEKYWKVTRDTMGFSQIAMVPKRG